MHCDVTGKLAWSQPGALAKDSRKVVRQHVAQELSTIHDHKPLDDAEQTFLHLVDSPDRSVRRSVAADIARWLNGLDELARTDLLARWALSERATVRETVALALASGVTYGLGATWTVKFLSNDCHPAVRAAAARAAAARYENNPSAYQKALNRLVLGPEHTLRVVV